MIQLFQSLNAGFISFMGQDKFKALMNLKYLYKNFKFKILERNIISQRGTTSKKMHIIKEKNKKLTQSIKSQGIITNGITNKSVQGKEISTKTKGK